VIDGRALPGSAGEVHGAPQTPSWIKGGWRDKEEGKGQKGSGNGGDVRGEGKKGDGKRREVDG